MIRADYSQFEFHNLQFFIFILAQKQNQEFSEVSFVVLLIPPHMNEEVRWELDLSDNLPYASLYKGESANFEAAQI